jgi:hypothetical protein
VSVTRNGEREVILGEWWQVGPAWRWERGGVNGVGLVRGRSGPAGSRVRPKWAAGSFFLFFSFCFLFVLFLISVLGFWKCYSILIWIKTKLATFAL